MAKKAKQVYSWGDIDPKGFAAFVAEAPGLGVRQDVRQRHPHYRGT
jgi:hypothetical protein